MTETHVTAQFDGDRITMAALRDFVEATDDLPETATVELVMSPHGDDIHAELSVAVVR